MSTGLDVEAPEEACGDRHCPFHGSISVRGSSFRGRIESTAMERSATVRWEHSQKVPKYERYERRNTKVTAHVPDCIEVEEGDSVRLVETRPISKTKSSVIVEVL